MRIYIDDDGASPILVRLLKSAGHNAVLPVDVGLQGEEDPIHLTYAIRQDRVFLSRNYRDFENLHNLIIAARGHHPGILIARRDNDSRRNPTPPKIIRAIRNLLAAGLPLADHYHKLNPWQ